MLWLNFDNYGSFIRFKQNTGYENDHLARAKQHTTGYVNRDGLRWRTNTEIGKIDMLLYVGNLAGNAMHNGDLDIEHTKCGFKIIF